MANDNLAPAANEEIGILARRRIEAEILAPVYDELKAEIGPSAAQALLRRAIRRAAIQAGQDFAARAPNGPDLTHFQDIQRLWTKDDALQVEVLEATPERYDFNVRRCRYAETYKAMGLAEIGAVLSCERDGAFCEGYNPDIAMTRTQTIMQGGDHCDFRYAVKRRE